MNWESGNLVDSLISATLDPQVEIVHGIAMAGYHILLFSEMSPRETGRFVGQAIVYCLLLAGIIKCIKISKRATTHALCVSSLTVFLTSWLLSAVAGNFLESRFAQFLVFLVLIATWVTSIVLGIVGLSDYKQSQGTYVQGRKQAWWGILLSCIAFLLVGAVFVNEVAKQEGLFESTVKQADRSIDARTGKSFEDLNFRFSAPQKWVSLPPKTLNPEATATYLRKRPDVYFMIIAERPGAEAQFNAETLLTIAQANLRAGGNNVRIHSRYDEPLDGIDGICYEASATADGLDVRYSTWVGTHNGFAYQLIAFSEEKDGHRLGAIAREIRRGFSLIDREAFAYAPGKFPMQKHQAPAFGYELDVASSGNWFAIDEVDSDVPTADLYVSQAGTSGQIRFAVIPIDRPLPKVEDRETFAFALSSLFTVTSLKQVKKEAREIHAYERSCLEVRGFTSPTGTDLGFVARFVPGKQYDFLVVGWWSRANDYGENRVNTLFKAASFFPSRGEVAHLPAERRTQLSVLLNDIGVMWYGKGKWELAKGYFRAALKYDSNETFHENIVNAQLQQDDATGALVSLEKALQKFPDSQALLSKKAEALASKGDGSAACSLYQKLFSTGYKGEDELLAYLNLAVEAEKIDNAIAVLNIYLLEHPSTRVERWRATMYSHKGNHEKAVLLAKEIIDDHGEEFDNIYALAEIYELAGSYSDALKVCEELQEEFPKDVGVMNLKGRCEFSLQRYPQARETFAGVQKLSPFDEEAGQYLKYIAALLGKGDRSQITTPITPVALPPELKEMMDEALSSKTDSANENFDLCEYYRVTGIAYEKNKQRRISTFRHLTVNTSAGVDSASTISCKFNPLYERIFVDKLVVLDEDGNRVAEGSLEDYYVLDEADQSEATEERRLYLPVPQLKPGYTIEVTYTVEDLSAPEEFGHELIALVAANPLRLGAVYFSGDLSGINSAFSRVDSNQVSANVHVWSIESPTIFEYESLQAPVMDFVSWVQIADAGSTWEEIGREYLESIDEKLALEDDIKKLAQEITTDATSTSEKIAALASYVQEECTYKAIEFGVRSKVPNTASLVKRNGYGDCKDHSVLLMQLLRGAGIEAELALVNASGSVLRDLPSLEQFDHMIVYVPVSSGSSRELFLDATEKYTAPTVPQASGLHGKLALVLNHEEPRLKKMPGFPSEAGKITIDRVVSLAESTASENDDLTVSEEILINRFYAAYFRRYFELFASRDRRRALRELFVGIERIHVKDFKFVNLNEPMENLVMQVDYKIPDALKSYGSDASADRVVLEIPSLWEHYLVDVDRDASRVTPFKLEMPISIRAKTEFRFPESYRVMNKEKLATRGGSKFIRWATRVSEEDGAFVVESSIKRNIGLFEPREFQDYYKSIQDLTKAIRSPLRMEIDLSQP